MSFKHVAWARRATIYEVNLRQFSKAGTLAAFAKHLPRLKGMGVDILWFMPLHPIGRRHRKGTLGSYYAVRDYKAVNPEFGQLKDFKAVVQQAHALGMKVLIDWVANHTAWDHAWVKEQPDWYKKDAKGQVHAYTYRASPDAEPEFWTDVVGLDFDSPLNRRTLWPAMTDAMAWWLLECDIDGFRCDVASLVPTAFWDQARAAFERIKPVFMLAESDAPDLHARAFDMTYDWKLYDALKAIAQGQTGASALHAWWANECATYPRDAYRMRYTSNHDINSWHGDDVTHFGEAFQAMAVLAATLPGMPLVYGGQEAVLDRKLAFFEKDPIDWGDVPMAGFYADLLDLKHRQAALVNGGAGNHLTWFDAGDAVAAFVRGEGRDRVGVMVNLTNQTQRAMGETLGPWASLILSPAR